MVCRYKPYLIESCSTGDERLSSDAICVILIWRSSPRASHFSAWSSTRERDAADLFSIAATRVGAEDGSWPMKGPT